MATPKKRNYKTTKLRSFLFFILIAVLFWVLTKFSKEYTATVSATLQYVSLPNTTLLAEDNRKTISFDLTANGFEFLFHKLNEPIIQIEVAEYYTEGASVATVPKEELGRLITNQLDKSVSVKNISINELTIQLNVIVVKKVPVLVNSDLTFKKGFMSVDSIRITPDSVQISGPTLLLDSIQAVETELISGSEIENDIEQKVAIAPINSEELSIMPSEVTIAIHVEEFAEKQLQLPVEVINLPESIELQLIPNTVTVTFNVSVTDFNAITAKNFKLICDYAERNEDDNFMVAKLSEKPNDILDVELGTKKINYLIFK